MDPSLINNGGCFITAQSQGGNSTLVLIFHRTTGYILFCTKHHIFSVIIAKNTEIIISLFNSELEDRSNTPGPSPNQLKHTYLCKLAFA
jgi:hypothetical protein